MFHEELIQIIFVLHFRCLKLFKKIFVSREDFVFLFKYFLYNKNTINKIKK